jgi:octaprenyl-diphosphate synthase
MQLEQIKDHVKLENLKVNDLITANLYSSVTTINNVSSYITKAGGKRLRPLIVLLISKACGYTGDLHTLLAVIIEFIHTATLLHDDVIDASELRRGKQTANSIWDNQTSVLVGDFLYSRAFQMLLKIDNTSILKILADTTNAIAEGEVLQLAEQHNLYINEDCYFKIITAKTAKLFAAASSCAAILSGGNLDNITACTSFGLNLGIAYQLIDDMLDYKTDDLHKLGKNLGDDLKEGKITLPLIHALHNSKPQQITVIKNIIKTIKSDKTTLSAANSEKILEILISSKSLHYTFNHASKYIKLATDALNAIPDSEYKTALHALSNFILTRNY